MEFLCYTIYMQQAYITNVPQLYWVTAQDTAQIYIGRELCLIFLLALFYNRPCMYNGGMNSFSCYIVIFRKL